MLPKAKGALNTTALANDKVSNKPNKHPKDPKKPKQLDKQKQHEVEKMLINMVLSNQLMCMEG